MKKILICIIILLQCAPGFAQQKVKPITKPAAKKVTKIIKAPAVFEKLFSNGIKMKINGFVVSDAKLYFDDGGIVPDDNTVVLNQKITMQVIIDSGYKIIDGKVFPGGSEKIILTDGYEVLNSEDLFAQYDETGVAPEDGKYISLKAMMTDLKDKSKGIIVRFKIWDKKSKSEITGSYKFHIK